MDQKDFKMSYMAQKDRSIAMRVNGNFKADLFNMFAIINEINLYNTWIPACHSAQEVTHPHCNTLQR